MDPASQVICLSPTIGEQPGDLYLVFTQRAGKLIDNFILAFDLVAVALNNYFHICV